MIFPLQLCFTLNRNAGKTVFTEDNIGLAEAADVPAWMELMRLIIDGYPVMDEEGYKIIGYIKEKHALVLKDGDAQLAAATLTVYGLFLFLTIPADYLAGLLVSCVYGDTVWYLTVAELTGFGGMLADYVALEGRMIASGAALLLLAGAVCRSPHLNGE